MHWLRGGNKINWNWHLLTCSKKPVNLQSKISGCILVGFILQESIIKPQRCPEDIWRYIITRKDKKAETLLDKVFKKTN